MRWATRSRHAQGREDGADAEGPGATPLLKANDVTENQQDLQLAVITY
ncbi:hypothetical protein PF005_g17082 [Phytophthora fragariae]|uniref:Uncharacterized protein n=1 Tax=Phytophthora fragariae TaxID=53985 RepID=A0A6A3X465_9STRA|nr:hypothetical protein PF005_g17082 [Phytophthora fragariae]KAE9212130.1 hypothetical protein PF002_g18334 [Phytophthora fragariae]